MEELADAIGVTYQQVQKYERGANRISAVRLIDIAQALEASTNDLLSLSQEIKHAEGLSSNLLSKDTTELLRLYSQVKGKESRKNVLRFLRMLTESGQD